MRLRSYDEYYDPAKLAEGRAELTKRLDSFLDHRVEGDGDGWAPVSSEDHVELRDLLYQIIALKWGTDADGDLPINFATVDRNQGRLISDVVPYSLWQRRLEDKTPEEIEVLEAEYQMQMLDTLGFLASNINEELRMMSQRARERVRELKELREAQAEAAAFLELLESRTDESNYDSDKASAIHLSKEVLSHSSAEMKQINDRMAAVYPKALSREIEAIVAVMETVEDDNAPNYGSLIRQPRTDTGRAFGNHYTGHERLSFLAQEHYRKGAAARKAARQAKNA